MDEDVSKALMEVTVPGATEVSKELGRSIGKVLGGSIEEAGGMFTDWLKEVRIRNLHKIMQKTEKILKRRGIEEPKPISPKLAIPAFEAASEEGDETLQDMWANLMANAMDPNQRDISLQRVFIETLKQFEPLDALVLSQLTGRVEPANPSLRLGRLAISQIATAVGVRETLTSMSADRLERLGCLHPDEVNYEMADGTTVAGARGGFLTPLGYELYLACQPDAADLGQGAASQDDLEPTR